MKKTFTLLFVLFALSVSAQGELAANINLNTAEKVFRSPDVDFKPQLKNGLNALSAYISNHYKFPEIKNKKIKIFVSFIVEPDGKMSDVKAFYISIKDLVSAENQSDPAAVNEANKKYTEPLKAEAIRVVSAFNEKWIPATKDGKTVRCLYNYPINFNIE